MKISLFTAILLLFTSPVRANIDAIDGMYLVSPKGISQVSSSGAKDRHGNYTVEIKRAFDSQRMVVYDNTAILYRRLSNQTQIASLQCF